MSDLDKFSYHEALDRLALFAGIVESEVFNHEVVQRHGEIRMRVSLAVDHLAESYQELGKLIDTLDSAARFG